MNNWEKKIIITPSLITLNMLRLEEQVKELELINKK